MFMKLNKDIETHYTYYINKRPRIYQPIHLKMYFSLILHISENDMEKNMFENITISHSIIVFKGAAFLGRILLLFIFGGHNQSKGVWRLK